MIQQAATCLLGISFSDWYRECLSSKLACDRQRLLSQWACQMEELDKDEADRALHLGERISEAAVVSVDFLTIVLFLCVVIPQF